MQIDTITKPLTITLNNQRAIKYVCQGPPLNEHLESGDVVIEGELATLLYRAVTGHEYNEHPDEADESRAIGARWTLVTTQSNTDAQLALIQFGHVIRPWLGWTKWDSNGHPILDAEEYKLEIPLDIPKNSPTPMRMVVV